MRVLLTIDVEAHRVVDEISGKRHDSLGRVLSLLEAHSVKGTFFVDLCEVETWGEAVIRRACDRILEQGHDLELHVHPHHSSGDASRWLLSEYSHDEQRVILSKAIERYRQYVGVIPHAFRAGGFGLNDNTIDLLSEAGVAVDCSYMWRRAGCNIAPPRKGLPCLYRGMHELPMTPAISWGTGERPMRVAPLDFNWLPLSVLQDAITTLSAVSAPVAVLLLHSSSMYVRVGKRRLIYRRAHEDKLTQLLEFLGTNRVQTSTVKDVSSSLQWDGDALASDTVYLARGVPRQYRILLFQSVIGFGVSARFRAFLLGNLAVAALLIGIVVWALRQ